ncbi:hypothetical protein V3N99_09265 [Dermatophilaceae bacterium Soc4.6]
MDITLLYLEDCPNRMVADEWLTALGAERPGSRVTHHLVNTRAEAVLDDA